MLWIFFTIAAAILQSFRNLEQKFLNKKLDGLTVTWSRFLLPFPLALIVVFCGHSLVGNKFIGLCLITAFFQIFGNFLLLHVIKFRNFSIGIAFYKTEILQSLLIAILIFGQEISLAGFVAILITFCGMFLMSNLSVKKFEFDQAAFFGTLCGLCFSISAFSLKNASTQLKLIDYSNYSAGITALMWTIFFQNLIFLLIKISQKTLVKDLRSLFVAENKFSFFKMSLLSFVGSILWFIAYAIGEVVYIKAVGQIELIAALLISWHLKEKHKTREFVGIFVTAIGILALIFSQ